MSIAVQQVLFASAAFSATLMTEAEFLDRHGSESRVDLVDGVVLKYPMPGFKHGVAGNNFAVDLTNFVRSTNLGRVCNNDTFIRVKTEPIRIRGADVAFLSYTRWPAERELPDGPMPATPELVAEVKCPSDTWISVFTKVLDYLDAGVQVVVVLDPETATATVSRADALQEIFLADATLSIPDLLPGFNLSVASLFQ